jgi:cytochrome bd-type quinol oxidase subunit 2
MYLYTTIGAIVAVVAGILIAVCTKKADGVVYGKLDKAGRIVNILLILVYVCLLPLCMFLGMIANPRYDGLLGVLGWIVAIVMGSAPLFCGLGLGFSVALRKKGKAKLSFAVQFAGVGGIGLTLILFFLFYGNLLKPLN